MEIPLDVKEFLEQKLSRGEITKDNFNLQMQQFSKFYETLCEQIQMRFDFDCPVMKNLKSIEPEHILNSDYDILVKAFKTLLGKLSHVLEIGKRQLVVDEYQEFICQKEKFLPNQESRLDTCWNSILETKRADGTAPFSNLKFFVETLLILPHSTASVERLFSTINQSIRPP